MDGRRGPGRGLGLFGGSRKVEGSLTALTRLPCSPPGRSLEREGARERERIATARTAQKRGREDESVADGGIRARGRNGRNGRSGRLGEVVRCCGGEVMRMVEGAANQNEAWQLAVSGTGAFGGVQERATEVGGDGLCAGTYLVDRAT